MKRVLYHMLPYAPFIVLAVAGVVAALHIRFYW